MSLSPSLEGVLPGYLTQLTAQLELALRETQRSAAYVPKRASGKEDASDKASWLLEQVEGIVE